MDLNDTNSALDKVKLRVRKQDHSLKMMFNPNQFIIGNHACKLSERKPLIFEYNPSGRFFVRFTMASDPKMGYTERGYGLALTQLRCISLKDELHEHPAVIVCTLLGSCFDKVCQTQPGMKETIENGLKHNKRCATNMAFTLKPWHEAKGTFMKVQMNELDRVKEYEFDFDNMKSILLQDLRDVWRQVLGENPKNRAGMIAGDVDGSLVHELSAMNWAQYLFDHQLAKYACPKTGGVMYNRMTQASYRQRRSAINSGDYKRGLDIDLPFERNPDYPFHQEAKPVKKRRISGNHLSQPIQWTGQEGWIRGKKDPYTRHQYGLEQCSSSYQNLLHRIQLKNQSNCENENIPQKQKSFDEPMEQDIGNPLQNNNGMNTLTKKPADNPPQYGKSVTLNDVEAVTKRMMHLGEEVPDVAMLPVPGSPLQSQKSEQNDTGFNFASGDKEEYPKSVKKVSRYSSSYVTHSPCMNGRSQGDKVSASPQQKVSRPVATGDARGQRPDGDETLLTYPPNTTDHVTVQLKDMKTLDRKEFLNDNVMAFMLNYISHHMIDKALLDKIYMCNSFFYSNLTRQIPTLCFTQRAERPISLENHKTLLSNIPRAIRWTKKFDVFAKDYIVIPVNEDLHWMVVAIINPGGAIVDLTDEENSRKAPKCYVLFFDPLSGLDKSRRLHVGHCITTWLSELYQATKTGSGKFVTKGKPTEYDKDRVVLMRPKNTPIQDNFSDCGLYALHFVEGLFCSPKRPVVVEDLPDLDWNEMWPEAEKMCDLMRDKIYNLIIKLSPENARSRLAKFEKFHKCGLNREGDLRKSRRHSAACFRRKPRHQDYHARHYSLSPPAKNVIYDDPVFTNPRALAKMPVTQLVRGMKRPRENFPVAY